MSLSLFIYGSLRDPAVRTRLLGSHTILTICPAVLRGHESTPRSQFNERDRVLRESAHVFVLPFINP